MTYAYRCEVCGGDAVWTLTRRGDVAATWADAEHLHEVLLNLQRDFEVTEIVVRHYGKTVEWADIDRSLTSIWNDQ